MAQLSLRPRLEAAAGFVPRGARLLDIGTDHARLPAALTQRGWISAAAATDIGEGPLCRARRTLELTGLSDRVILLKRDGLWDVDSALGDTLTMTGMGGETIAQILEPHPWTRTDKTLILQPTTGADALRRFLERAGYRVEAEKLTLDAGRLYQTLLCRGGEQRYEHPAHYFTGTALGEDPLFPVLLEKLERRFSAALSGLSHAEEAQAERRAEFDRILTEVRRLKWQR